jgi:hypothetical protein
MERQMTETVTITNEEPAILCDIVATANQPISSQWIDDRLTIMLPS